MKRCKPSYLPGNPVSEVSGPSGEVSIFPRQAGRSRFLIVLALAMATLAIVVPSYGQNAINCSSGFSSSSSSSCYVQLGNGANGGQDFSIFNNGAGAELSGNQVLLVPAGGTHNGYCFAWQQALNVQAFTATFTFVPNGGNLAFVLNNNTNGQAGGEGPTFCAGAGGEGGFFQEYDSATPPYPNNIFALEFDSYYSGTGGSFTYSSVQIYSTGQEPFVPADNGNTIAKISTSPVPLDSPASSQGTTTGDTYSATITYDGSNVTLKFYDVTAQGSCPGSNCFTHTWSNVNIPSLVGSNTAYLAFTSGVGESATHPLYVDSVSYTAGTAQQAPTAPTALLGNIAVK